METIHRRFDASERLHFQDQVIKEHANPFEIYGYNVEMWHDSLRVLRLSPVIIIPVILHTPLYLQMSLYNELAKPVT
jgi:hypothetical protein